MKKIKLKMKRYVFPLAAGLMVAAGVSAQQQDSLLRRQMELERQFNPTLKDAVKISSLPALPEPAVRKPNVEYASWAGRTNPPMEIAIPRPASIMTEIPYSTERGYFFLNAGNYANVDGALGYRLVDTENDRLSVRVLHNSTNGDVKYVQQSDPATMTAYFMDNKGQAEYSHRFDASHLEVEASYLLSQFNYYGNTFGKNRIFDDEKQRLKVFHAKAGLESSESEENRYKGIVDFKHFSSKFGSLLTEKGMAGNQLEAMAGMMKPLDRTDGQWGADAKVTGVFYSQPSDVKNYLLVNAAPFVLFDGMGWNARLGADVLLQFGDNDMVRVAPNVEFTLMMTDKSSLYANVKGGIDDNTYLNVMQESRYYKPGVAVKPSFTYVDVEAGIKMGELEGFRLDVFGGFRKTDNAHFPVMDQVLQSVPETGIETDSETALTEWVVKEPLVPAYGNLSHSHIGGLIRWNIWAPLDISFRLKKNFYSVKDARVGELEIDEAKAWNLPDLETDVRVVIQTSDEVKFTVDYYLASGRWSFFNGENVKMKNINDLNAGMIYNITPAISLNVRVHNILSKKYDIWYGYPAQTINILGGFAFQF
jgi:hypothetical protein